MDIPPDILFHRYFSALSPEKRKTYRGKLDLAKPSLTGFEQLLVEIQDVLNESLRDASADVGHHAEHTPFHVDYVDSDVENAIAFRHDGFSFIGLTEPLINRLWRVCDSLSRVAAQALQPALSKPIAPDAIREVFFRVVLFFVVAHEYTHHVHGHTSHTDSRDLTFNEVLSGACSGDLESQSLEIDADGYATFLVLRAIVQGPARTLSLELLALELEPKTTQDSVLLSYFIMAVGAFFLSRPAATPTPSNVYTMEHPLQVVRMNCVVRETHRWCDQDNKPLSEWLTIERLNFLMGIVSEAVLGSDTTNGWIAQSEFLSSKPGEEYLKKLDQCRIAHIQSLQRVDGTSSPA